MDLNFLTLNGYGQFVWPAFLFTFVVCYYLYSRTINEFNKLQKMFLETFESPLTVKITVIKHKKSTEKFLTGSTTF